jgi:hypothetical protein
MSTSLFYVPLSIDFTPCDRCNCRSSGRVAIHRHNGHRARAGPGADDVSEAADVRIHSGARDAIGGGDVSKDKKQSEQDGKSCWHCGLGMAERFTS